MLEIQSLPIQAMAPWILTLGATVLLVLQMTAGRRRMAALESELKGRYEELGRELHAVSSGSMGVGRRLMECEKYLHQLQGTVDELRQNDPARVSYDEASRLVGLGADIQDLMDTCGISRPEAELVSAMHRRQAETVN
ncbi:DUF2802 domain-containing protein [Hydrocarboniclastica marina]|uniref:DUF2802 domain-containing protein n=1 Tax=Hydrocarboniclastica marina TaxID=2259620 RepID=A0A4P7XFF1_9ALTE|nr:DUF2802 domain-containing protein [Hydrocarboniclastica marina]MAL98551.1 hypothetical protein [Alteromonadaceae bacterium]QCF25699.1 DUF2802 domain-containing protein [Hydrocarboniclastica marina]|tara:strand:- start:1607 stop:2020 length:414 start_codon:yes stop_codon:yes gene_type:complete